MNPITGAEVEVTSLDGPAAEAAPAPAPAPKSEAQALTPPTSEATVKPEGETTPEEAPEATPEATTEATPEAPPVVKSPAQLACEKRKGVWTQTASGNAAFCQTPTRDGGKFCRKSTDCEGYCLARSQSCAPVTPMFGCQEILNEDGRVLTQCIN